MKGSSGFRLGDSPLPDEGWTAGYLLLLKCNGWIVDDHAVRLGARATRGLSYGRR
jgi:hypothetical protein